MKVNKRLISAAAVALLLAAPVVSWDVSSQLRSNWDASAAVGDYYGYSTMSPGSIETYNKNCSNFSTWASGSKIICVCTVSYKDHSGSHKKNLEYDHCYNNKTKKDHYAWIKNNAGKTKKKEKVKCGKKATASVTCNWKTSKSKIKAKWGVHDGYFDEIDSGWQKLSTID